MSLIASKSSCDEESKLATAAAVSPVKQSSFLNTELRHVAQESKNDCGHACARMALNYLYRHQTESIRQEKKREFDALLQSLGLEGISLWTIDIAHICSLKNIKHQMYTITLGVNDAYSEEEFYSADKDFESEKQRIRDKFRRAAELGIQVARASIGLDRIKQEIEQKTACIVLVNANLLNGENIYMDDDQTTTINDSLDHNQHSLMSSLCCCTSSKNHITGMGEMRASHLSPSSIRSTDKMSSNSNNNYSGHFIVVMGYDDHRQIVFYRNPASARNLSFTSYECFEAARHSYGTDQDILFVYQI